MIKTRKSKVKKREDEVKAGEGIKKFDFPLKKQKEWRRIPRKRKKLAYLFFFERYVRVEMQPKREKESKEEERCRGEAVRRHTKNGQERHVAKRIFSCTKHFVS